MCKLYTGSFPYLVSVSLYCQSCNETVLLDVHTNSFLLTIWIFCWLYTHVRFTLLHAWLPLSAFFFQCSLSTTFCIDVGKVCRRVMVGLHGLIVLYLKCDQYCLIAPLDDFRLDITAACITQIVVTQSYFASSGWYTNDHIISVFLFTNQDFFHSHSCFKNTSWAFRYISVSIPGKSYNSFVFWNLKIKHLRTRHLWSDELWEDKKKRVNLKYYQ